MNPESSYKIAYALFRITLGVNMFFHGFMRIISDTGAWVEGLVVTFSDSFLPESVGPDLSLRAALVRTRPGHAADAGAVHLVVQSVGGALMMLAAPVRQHYPAGLGNRGQQHALHALLLSFSSLPAPGIRTASTIGARPEADPFEAGTRNFCAIKHRNLTILRYSLLIYLIAPRVVHFWESATSGQTPPNIGPAELMQQGLSLERSQSRLCRAAGADSRFRTCRS